MNNAVENNAAKKRLPDLRLYMLTVVVMLAGAGLLYWRSVQPRRVDRSHAQTIAGEFQYLTRRFDFDPPWDSWQSRARAQEDLDELEWLLENRYSYLHLKGVDYKAALDSIRCSLGDGIQRSLFGYQLSKFIALFGDGNGVQPDIVVEPLGTDFIGQTDTALAIGQFGTSAGKIILCTCTEDSIQ